VALEIARFMNEKHKVVASQKPFEPGMIMFCSNNLCVGRVKASLIDEFPILVNPFALGSGISLFQDLSAKADLKLIHTHSYPSRKILLTYTPRSQRRKGALLRMLILDMNWVCLINIHRSGHGRASQASLSGFRRRKPEVEFPQYPPFDKPFLGCKRRQFPINWEYG